MQRTSPFLQNKKIMIIIILAFILAVVGTIGAVVPGIPGPVLSWAALFLLSFSDASSAGTALVAVAAVAAVIITVMDYVIPSVSTKKFGGSKAGVWGCNVGLVISIIGLPFGPQGLLGVIVWPFLGALIGEYLKCHDFKISAHAAFGAFIGFLCGSGLKLIFGVVILFIMIMDMIHS